MEDHLLPTDHAHEASMFTVSLSAGSEADTCRPATGGGTCTPCTQVVRDPVEALCSHLRQAITPILAQRPSRERVPPKRRPRQQRQPVSNPRSVRIAKRVGRGSTATKQQNVLIRKLCLANEGGVISDEALQAYIQLFNEPLAEAHIKAILAMFGWEPEILPLRTAAVEDHQ